MYVSLKIVLHGPKHVACSEQMRTANYYEVYFYILSPVLTKCQHHLTMKPLMEHTVRLTPQRF